MVFLSNILRKKTFWVREFIIISKYDSTKYIEKGLNTFR